MGLTTTENFTVAQHEIAMLIKALPHLARVAIIEYLMKVDACICGDIVNELPLAQQLIRSYCEQFVQDDLD